MLKAASDTRFSGAEKLATHVRDPNKLGLLTGNEIMDFHSRKLVFLRRPEDVTVELSEWH